MTGPRIRVKILSFRFSFTVHITMPTFLSINMSLLTTVDNNFLKCKSFKTFLTYRSSVPVLPRCASSFQAHPWSGTMLIKLKSRFVDIVLLHGSYSMSLLYVCVASSSENTSGILLLNTDNSIIFNNF